MNERIKKLRKALDLTQQAFAERIGSSQNLITNYESGRRNPSSSAINNICKTFNVNEDWLRTGEGEMFNPESVDELDMILRKYGLPGFLRGLFLRYSKLPPEARVAFETMIQEWATEIADETRERELSESIDSKVEAYRQQLLAGSVPDSGNQPSQEMTDAKLREMFERQLAEEKTVLGAS